jgi:MOSC domain-containing protein YiiM
LRTDFGVALTAAEHRRNVTVRGVQLSSLLGQRFRIGEVLLEGVKDCPPCEHLEKLTGKPVLQPLLNRGGLRARVLEGGTIHIGDQVSAADTAAPPQPLTAAARPGSGR